MFEIPESDAHKPANRFEFKGRDGKTYSVPLLGFVCGEASIHFEAGRELEGSLAAFDDDLAREQYRSMDRDQRTKFDAAWVAASKVSPGESQGSAGSSESTTGQ